MPGILISPFYAYECAASQASHDQWKKDLFFDRLESTFLVVTRNEDRGIFKRGILRLKRIGECYGEVLNQCALLGVSQVDHA